MNEVLRPIKSPELVFGLVAPIGVDLDVVSQSLIAALDAVEYKASEFRLTKLMRSVPVGLPLSDDKSVESYRQRIAYANEVRRRLGNDAFASISTTAIRAFRASVPSTELPPDIGDVAARPDGSTQALKSVEEFALPRRAYILHQLKRPEEIELLRKAYGRQFIQISAWAPEEQRCARIRERQRSRTSSKISDSEIDHHARALIEQDSNEGHLPNGQRVRDAFPLGDVFIDASTRASTNETITRFIKLLFGNNWLTPTRDEYAMYIAKSASLRSSDLSRQVGAAVFSDAGEVITLGCNEVPKAGGGTYWEGDAGDARDFQLGRDANDAQKFEVLVDLVERMRDEKLLSGKLNRGGDARAIARQILDHPNVSKAKLMDLIEFGRVIHAESAALADASRKGLAVRGASLYCTTFPCHLCATNIIAAGISRVVYIEPYPKSYANLLHKDAIALDGGAGKVSFEPFVGVSPYRYRDLFERKRRKDENSEAQEWKDGERRPLIDVYDQSHTIAEAKIGEAFSAKVTEEFGGGSAATRSRSRKSVKSRTVSQKRPARKPVRNRKKARPTGKRGKK